MAGRAEFHHGLLASSSEASFESGLLVSDWARTMHDFSVEDKMAEEPRTPELKATEQDQEGKRPGEQKADAETPQVSPENAVQDALEEDRFEATDN